MIHRLWLSVQRLLPGGTTDQWLDTGVSLALLLVLAWIANWITKQIVYRLLPRVLGRVPIEEQRNNVRAFVARLSNVVPALIVESGIATVPNLPGGAETVVRRLAMAFIVITVAMALGRALTIANNRYERRPEAQARPIKGFVELLKIALYCAAAILVVAGLIGQSPLLLLSGFGAITAVLMLVFKDTLLSLVASIQIGSTDMVRIGDWITMEKYNVDGNVVDIALHTITVQNWDKTISTVPTYSLISDSFRNWRNVSKRGIWRILRSLMLDQNSVHFLDEADRARLARFSLLRDYLQRKEREIGDWNRTHEIADHDDRRRLTNIGTFRAYVLAYVAAQPKIVTSGETFVVRQLDPTADGLPLQIYAYVDGVSWSDYERIQSDIFDHLIAILPEFSLRLFQRPTGFDTARLEANLVRAAQLRAPAPDASGSDAPSDAPA